MRQCHFDHLTGVSGLFGCPIPESCSKTMDGYCPMSHASQEVAHGVRPEVLIPSYPQKEDFLSVGRHQVADDLSSGRRQGNAVVAPGFHPLSWHRPDGEAVVELRTPGTN